MSWRPSTVSPRQLVSDGQPSSVRVSLVDGRQFVLREPSISGDSIVGDTVSRSAGRTVPRVSVATQDVLEIETRQFNAVQTAILIAAPVVGASVFAWWICRDIDC